MRKPPSRRLFRRLSRSLPVDGSRHFRLVRGHVVHILLLSRRFVPGSSRPVHRSSRRHLNAAAPADNGIRLNARGAKCSAISTTLFLPVTRGYGRIRITGRRGCLIRRIEDKIERERVASLPFQRSSDSELRSVPVTARSANSMDPEEASRTKTSKTASLFHHTLRPTARKIRSSRWPRFRAALNVRVSARETSIFSERSSWKSPARPESRRPGDTRKGEKRSTALVTPP